MQVFDKEQKIIMMQNFNVQSYKKIGFTSYNVSQANLPASFLLPIKLNNKSRYFFCFTGDDVSGHANKLQYLSIVNCFMLYIYIYIAI